MSSPQAQDMIKTANEITPQVITSPGHHSVSSPQPELATMTNVNVLDLHKDYGADKDSNTVQYIYSAAPKPAPSDSIKIETDHLVNGSIVQRVTPGGQVIDGRLAHEPRTAAPPIIGGNHVDQLFEKMGLSDEQILRLIGSNGESQQIVSREIINGEPHILTRTESGEHVLTRIVTTEPKLSATDNAIYTTVANEPNDSPESDIVYTAAPNHIATSVLQYSDAGIKGALQHSYTPTSGVTGSVITATTPSVMVENNAENEKSKSQIIYTTDVSGIKEEVIYSSDKVPIFATTEDNGKPPIDLIYDDGGKTLIYTTTAGPKGLELYSGNELSLINSEGQVIVQGGLQYTTQQINGQTVFVVTEPMENEINAHQNQRLVIIYIVYFNSIEHVDVFLFLKKEKIIQIRTNLSYCLWTEGHSYPYDAASQTQMYQIARM